MPALLRRAWRREGVDGRLLRAALLPASWVYGAAAAVHRAWRRSRPKFDGSVPVILVGNLTVGGTGKTPIAMLAADRLRQAGMRPAIISRGYGGRRKTDPAVVGDGSSVLLDAAEAGDEPVMMARRGFAVVVGRDRVAAARLAVERGARSLVLDDGFQQRGRFPGALRIVAVNATDPFGGEALLPAGSLREPVRALRDAEIVVLTHPRLGEDAMRRLTDRILGLAGRVCIVRADHWLVGFAEPERPAALRPVGWLKGKTVLALAGIGDPWPFERKIQACGARLVASCVRPDHHRWTAKEVERAFDEAVRLGADAIITTAKDAVRLPLPAHPPVPVLVAELELKFESDRERGQFFEAVGSRMRAPLREPVVRRDEPRPLDEAPRRDDAPRQDGGRHRRRRRRR
jgi:tetraacyldisaccharide 4'-kinase